MAKETDLLQKSFMFLWLIDCNGNKFEAKKGGYIFSEIWERAGARDRDTGLHLNCHQFKPKIKDFFLDAGKLEIKY